MTTPPRIRKNIDSLTPEELADYEHAFSKLQEISDADPGSIDGLQYFQELHNSMLGPCEHANDIFLPWHRAHLFRPVKTTKSVACAAASCRCTASIFSACPPTATSRAVLGMRPREVTRCSMSQPSRLCGCASPTKRR